MPSSEQRVEALFQAAVQLAGAERTAFLNGACHGDPTLRQRLDQLPPPAFQLVDRPWKSRLAVTFPPILLFTL